jgi:hypothetical protein
MLFLVLLSMGLPKVGLATSSDGERATPAVQNMNWGRGAVLAS